MPAAYSRSRLLTLPSPRITAPQQDAPAASPERERSAAAFQDRLNRTLSGRSLALKQHIEQSRNPELPPTVQSAHREAMQAHTVAKLALYNDAGEAQKIHENRRLTPEELAQLQNSAEATSQAVLEASAPLSRLQRSSSASSSSSASASASPTPSPKLTQPTKKLRLTCRKASR